MRAAALSLNPAVFCWPGARSTDVFVYFNNDPGAAAIRNARTLRTMADHRGFRVANGG